jgi:hypothetical protein
MRLRRPGRDLRARHGPGGDLRPPGFRGAIASASRSAFLASSGISRSGFSRSGFSRSGFCWHGFCWHGFFKPGFWWPEYASRSLADRGLAGSGGDPGRWRRGVLDGVDRGVGGVLRSVIDVLRRIVDGFVGDGCCVVGWSGGYERSRRRSAGSRHHRADRSRS